MLFSDNHIVQDYEPVSFEFTVDDNYEVTKINYNCLSTVYKGYAYVQKLETVKRYPRRGICW